VGGAQIGSFDVRRDDSKGRIILVMKRHLASDVDAPRSDQSEPRFREGPAEWLPRREVSVHHPPI
jgi:hypothetical protein